MPRCRQGAMESTAALDVGDVRVPRLAQRRGHADVDAVDLGQAREVGRGLQQARLDHRRQLRRRHVDDVALAAVDGLDLLRQQFEAEHLETGLGVGHRQRQPHVTQSHHAQLGLLRLEPAACVLHGFILGHALPARGPPDTPAVHARTFIGHRSATVLTAGMVCARVQGLIRPGSRNAAFSRGHLPADLPQRHHFVIQAAQNRKGKHRPQQQRAPPVPGAQVLPRGPRTADPGCGRTAAR